ncbi:unnamed protein product [Enterobius vermicularis]|uniref:SSD domain-containing protein n=1 Tax=Enterobius vermicularis TaxID=51028 RepID=A0A3P6J3F7_ENTVE|nr:unnamed protein product [Enterobius vermicularis]
MEKLSARVTYKNFGVKGFESRSTYLSNNQLAISNAIQSQLDQYPTSDLVRQRRQYEERITKRESEIERYLNTPCKQYSLTGSHIRYEYIEVFSKIIFELHSMEQLFQLNTMQRLCNVDETVNKLFQQEYPENKNYKRLLFSYNLPLYAMCTADVQQPANCSDLNQTLLNSFATAMSQCLNSAKLENCPEPYLSQAAKLLFSKKSYQISSNKLNKPFHIAVILPVDASYSYYKFYERLLKQLKESFDDSNLKFVGAYFNVKPQTFERLVINDIIYGVIAAIMRMQFFPFLNLMAIVLIIAVGADDVFIFLHQFRQGLEVIFVALVAVLLQILKCNPFVMKEMFTDRLQLENQLQSAMNAALAHAALAMFVTSATTAIAFFTNFISSIIVLKCFGLYAGTTMLINYLFVITALPAIIIVCEKRRIKNQHKYYLSKFNLIWDTIKNEVSNMTEKACVDWPPKIVSLTRFILIPLSVIILVITIYAIVKKPGVRLPENNSMQLLRSEHPYEWFDENAEQLFDFAVGSKRKMNIIAGWGIKPTFTASRVNPYSRGELSVNDAFPEVLSKNLLQFANLVQSLVERYGNSRPKDLWISRFIEWANNSDANCKLLLAEGTKNFSLLYKCFLDFGKKNPTNRIYTQSLETLDGPLYVSNGRLVGYLLLTQSKYEFSLIYRKMKQFYLFVDKVERWIKNESFEASLHPIITGPPESTILYDLLEQIPQNTIISVFVSLGISMAVITATTFRLSLSFLTIICISLIVLMTIATVLWIGWSINVVEATIIVLTIGMSFDYTLHYAVSFRSLGVQNYFRPVYAHVTVPVLMSALSTFVAGAALVFANTQPFFELGLFLMIVTTASAFVAKFVFPSYVTTFLR